MLFGCDLCSDEWKRCCRIRTADTKNDMKAVEPRPVNLLFLRRKNDAEAGKFSQ
jgi:hypothetical protein